MAEKVLIGGSLNAWWLAALRVAGVALLVAGGLMFFGQVPFALAVTVAGGAALAAAEATAAYNARRRRWAEVTPEGFAVTDRRGTREYADEEVNALSYFTEDKYSGGVLKAVRRKLKLWIDGEPRPVEMDTTIQAAQRDPLEGFIERITKRLNERAEEELAAGRQVEGEGWTLGADQLSLGEGAAAHEYRLDELAAVDVFDQHVCVWQQGRDEAVARVPLESRNAQLLAVLLAARLESREPEPATPMSGLGRVLFERRPRSATFWILLLAAATCWLVGFALVAPGDTMWYGVATLAGGAGVAVGAWNSKQSSFRCHQHGVRKQSLFSDRQLRYDEVESFSYTAVRQFVNGVYSGTSFALSFTPVVGAAGSAISYSVTLNNEDADLGALRDHISQVIAGRMAEEMAAGRPVAWTPSLTFHPEGLEYRPKGLLGRKESERLPYGQISAFDIQQGTFHLWTHGQKKSVVQEECSQPNFYPGYFLLVMMAEGDGEGEGEGEAQEPGEGV